MSIRNILAQPWNDWRCQAWKVVEFMSETTDPAELTTSAWMRETIHGSAHTSLIMLRTYMIVQGARAEVQASMARFEAVMSATLPILVATIRTDAQTEALLIKEVSKTTDNNRV